MTYVVLFDNYRLNLASATVWAADVPTNKTANKSANWPSYVSHRPTNKAANRAAIITTDKQT